MTSCHGVAASTAANARSQTRVSSRTRARRVLEASLLSLSLAAPVLHVASANALPLERPRRSVYYWGHAAGTAAGFGAGWALVHATSDFGPGWDLSPFGPDDAVRKYFSPSASNLSDRLLWIGVTIPVAAQMSEGFVTEFGNATLVYTEALAANYLAFAAAKSLVRRPRPYTHAREPDVVDFSDRAGSAAFRSFWSGHTSTAFTAAMAGSALFAARTDEPWARHVMWGLEFGLAGLVGRLRVTSGYHYRTDVWAGMVGGAGIGLGIAALHRVELDRVRASEWAVAAGATVLTVFVSELVSICDLLGPESLCSHVRHRPPASSPAETRESGVSWNLLPAVFAQGAGAQVVGRF